MDAILRLRKGIFPDWLETALRKIEQVLSGPVNETLDGKSMSETSEIKNTKEREASFLKVLDDYHGIIDKICRSYCNSSTDQKDMYQEIVFQLWKAYPSFTGNSKISTWIYTVALRSAVQPYRRKNRIKIELPGILPDAPDEELNEEIHDRMFHLFHLLGDFEKAAFALMMEGYTREEIGVIMEFGKETVKKRMSRAMKAFENYYKK